MIEAAGRQSSVEAEIEMIVTGFAAKYSPLWQIMCRHREDDRRLELDHPASSGVVLDDCVPLSAGAQEAGTAYVSLLVDDAEFITASAAPALVHSELVSGLRAVLKVHDLDPSARRGLMALLIELGYLTSDEGEWLTRYGGNSTPAQGKGTPAA